MTTSTCLAMNPTLPTATPFATTPWRILYADDVKELRDIAQLSLSRIGHTVVCVEDGRAALAQVLADPEAFDLVITDHHMPVMNGLEFAKALRRTDYRGRLLVFCSELNPAVASDYEQLGADRIIYKPILPATLRKLIGELAAADPASSA
jgi:CheY-like chemotaxis protein